MRHTSSVYTAAGTQFQWADSDDDHPLFPEDLGRLAKAFDEHTHAATRGHAVARIADNSVHAGAYQAASIAQSKMMANSVGASQLISGSVGNTHLADASVSTSKYIDGSISAAKLGILSGNPAVRLGPLGHASYGSIRWDGDGQAGTMIYDHNAGGNPGRLIVQARNDYIHLMSANGAGWASVAMGSLSVQPNGAAHIHSSLSMLSNASIFVADTGQIIIRKTVPLANDMWPHAGLHLETTSIPTIAFHRPGLEAAAFYFVNGHMWMNAGVVARKMWDSGNMGSGSGMNADLLDGLHSDAFALQGHTHGATSVPATGGTFTGAVAFSAGLSTGALSSMNGLSMSAGIDMNGFGITEGSGFHTTSGQFKGNDYDGAANNPIFALRHNQGIYVSGLHEIGFATQSTGRGRITDSGNIVWLHNISCVDLTETSDRRLKENFLPAPPVNLRYLPVQTFNWKNDPKRRRIGVMAQDLQTAVPLAVSEVDEHLTIDPLAFAAAVLQYAQDIDHRFTQYQAQHP